MCDCWLPLEECMFRLFNVIVVISSLRGVHFMVPHNLVPRCSHPAKSEKDMGTNFWAV